MEIEQSKKSHKRRHIVTGALVLLLLVAVGASAYWFIAYRRADNSNPITRQQRAVAELSKFIEMPNEQPVVTTVHDTSKLTNETLAKAAKNGDQLFIFTQAKRIVLFRPSDKKVVDMLTIQDEPAVAPAATTTTKTNR